MIDLLGRAKRSSPGRRWICIAGCWLVSVALCADEVVTVTRDRELRRAGTIQDVKGDQLTLRIAGGREIVIPLDRVRAIDAEWSAYHVRADVDFAAGKYEEALELYRTAFNEEPRRWVKRTLLARVIWCQRNTGRWGDACRMFARLAEEDQQTRYFDAIPLLWDLKQCPPDVRPVVRDWLQPADRQAAQRLMAASWLLVSRRESAIRTLRELGKHPSNRIRGLAIAQLWRSELVTMQESRLEWWSSQIAEVPRALRAGPYYLLGQSYARSNRADEAALAFLRVPVEFAQDVPLAQKSLWMAIRSLQTEGRSDEVVQLLKELVKLGAQTEEGKKAAAKLAELAQS